MNDRLDKQIEFLLEIDKVKSIQAMIQDAVAKGYLPRAETGGDD